MINKSQRMHLVIGFQSYHEFLVFQSSRKIINTLIIFKTIKRVLEYQNSLAAISTEILSLVYYSLTCTCDKFLIKQTTTTKKGTISKFNLWTGYSEEKHIILFALALGRFICVWCRSLTLF